MLSTTYPQLMEIIVLIAVCVVSLLSIGTTSYVVRRLNREQPTKTEINNLRGEVAEQSGDLADLRDRFSRFQKREGLRFAREEKKTQADLVAEAQALQAQATGDIENKTVSPKRELYKRAFRQ